MKQEILTVPASEPLNLWGRIVKMMRDFFADLSADYEYDD